jgi:flagellar assembly protein FliH
MGRTSLSTNAPTPDPTTPLRKFLFERSFEGDLGMDFDEKPKPTFSEEQLEETRQAAFEEGRLAGQKAAEIGERKTQSVILGQIEQKMEQLLGVGDQQWQSQLAQLMEVALVIARKVVPVYATKNGLAEIEEIVTRVIDEMGQEPRLVIRVPATAFAELQRRIDEIAEKRAFSGKIIVLADDNMGPSDCRVEWADGGVERDFKKLWQEIDQIMEPYDPGALPLDAAADEEPAHQEEQQEPSASGDNE